jgi:hypothetical protein
LSSIQSTRNLRDTRQHITYFKNIVCYIFHDTRWSRQYRPHRGRTTSCFVYHPTESHWFPSSVMLYFFKLHALGDTAALNNKFNSQFRTSFYQRFLSADFHETLHS